MLNWRQVSWLFVLKKIVGVCAFYIASKYIIQRLIMIPLYPVQSRILKFFIHNFSESQLSRIGSAVANELNREGFIVRHVVLVNNGTRYSSLLIGKPSNMANGKWVIQATGNGEPIEHTGASFARGYASWGCNTLLVQGPGVGKSEGQAVPKTMGDAQEIGIRFLEEAVKAKKIIIAGRSLGGAAIGQAILSHNFKKDVRYLVIRQMTFDRISTICAKIIGLSAPRLEWIVSSLIHWAGCEIDSVEASRRLADLNIKEVIVQATGTRSQSECPALDDFIFDGVIVARASLGHALIEKRITHNKTFICLESAKHMLDCEDMGIELEISKF